MAHELDTLTTGELAYVGRVPAWHKGGKVFDRPITPDEALQTIEADHEVRTVPVYTRIMLDVQNDTKAIDADTQAQWQDEGRETIDEWHEAPDNRATVRMDRGTVLGVVGSRYTPLQNRDAFGVLTPLVDQGLARIETAGVLRGGRDVWMMVAYNLDSPIIKDVYEREGMRPYALISNNHTGRRQVRVMETTICVVCANTEAAAMSDFGRQKKRGRAFEVRHTQSVEAKTVEQAEKMFSSLLAHHEAIAAQYALLRRTHIDTALFRKLVLDIAAPIPAKLEKAKLTKREETSREQIQARRARLADLWMYGTGHTGDRSALEAMKAVSESVDHDAKLWRVKGGTEGRVTALLDGRLGSVKQEVTNALMAYATTAPETEAWRASIMAGDWK